MVELYVLEGGKEQEAEPDIVVEAVPFGLLMERAGEFGMCPGSFLGAACEYLRTGRSGPYGNLSGCIEAYFTPADKGLTGVRMHRLGELAHWVPEGGKRVETGYWRTDLSDLLRAFPGLQEAVA